MKKQYKKPRVVAKSQPKGSFVAGCPVKNSGAWGSCKACERSS